MNEGDKGWNILTLKEFVLKLIADNDASHTKDMVHLKDVREAEHATINAGMKDIREEMKKSFDDHQARHTREGAHLAELHDAQHKQTDIAIKGVEDLLAASIETGKIASAKFETATDHRFEGVNEFRAVLGEQQATYVTRNEIDSKFEAQGKRVQDNTDRLNQSEGKGSGLNAFWGYLIGAIGLVSIIFGMIWAITMHGK